MFRLGRTADGKIVPYYQPDKGGLKHAWALSEVSIAKRRASGVRTPSGDMAALVNSAKAEWGKWEVDIPLILLESLEDGSRADTWHGRITSPQGDRSVIYDKRLGLRFAAD